MTLLALILAFLGLFMTMDSEPAPVHPTTHVEVAVGETERLTLGEGNHSIGHMYEITRGDDEPGFTLVKDGTDPDPDCAPGGCYFTWYVDVTGKVPGTYEFEVQYCFRSGLPDCDTTGKAPVTYTVVVTE